MAVLVDSADASKVVELQIVENGPLTPSMPDPKVFRLRLVDHSMSLAELDETNGLWILYACDLQLLTDRLHRCMTGEETIAWAATDPSFEVDARLDGYGLLEVKWMIDEGMVKDQRPTSTGSSVTVRVSAQILEEFLDTMWREWKEHCKIT